MSIILRGMRPFFSASDEEIKHEIARYVYKDGFISTSSGFCLIEWPDSPLSQPQIMHFYDEGGAADRRLLRNMVLDKIREKGYNSFIAINGSGAPDAVWKRIFQHEDWEIAPVKTVHEFRLKGHPV